MDPGSGAWRCISARLADDIAALDAGRAVVGSEISLMVDFSQGLDLGLARHWNAALADEGEGSRLRHAGLHADWRRHRLATSGRDRWGGGHSDFDASLSRGGRPRYTGLQKTHWLEWQDWANPVLQRSKRGTVNLTRLAALARTDRGE